TRVAPAGIVAPASAARSVTMLDRTLNALRATDGFAGHSAAAPPPGERSSTTHSPEPARRSVSTSPPGRVTVIATALAGSNCRIGAGVSEVLWGRRSTKYAAMVSAAARATAIRTRAADTAGSVE